jgi:hypothetical protein
MIGFFVANSVVQIAISRLIHLLWVEYTPARTHELGAILRLIAS